MALNCTPWPAPVCLSFCHGFAIPTHNRTADGMKYKLWPEGDPGLPTCKAGAAYLTTTVDLGCYDYTSGQYEGYGNIEFRCVCVCGGGGGGGERLRWWCGVACAGGGGGKKPGRGGTPGVAGGGGGGAQRCCASARPPCRRLPNSLPLSSPWSSFPWLRQPCPLPGWLTSDPRRPSARPAHPRSCDEGKKINVPIYASGTFLGREACPWPAFLPGQDGYQPEFDFTNQAGAGGATVTLTPGPLLTI